MPLYKLKPVGAGSDPEMCAVVRAKDENAARSEVNARFRPAREVGDDRGYEWLDHSQTDCILIPETEAPWVVCIGRGVDDRMA